MTAPHRWTLRTLAAVTLIALAAGVTAAQVGQPGANPNPGAKSGQKHDPKHDPKTNPQPAATHRPAVNPHPPAMQRQPQPQTLLRPNTNSIVVMPSINTLPVVPAAGPFLPFTNPALSYPWPTPVAVPSFYPFGNPFTNPFAVAPFNPVLPNPFLRLPGNPLTNPFVAPGVIAVSTPPVALQQPGSLLPAGPDLAVNPWSGTVVQPVSGIATLANGSTFYRLPTAVGVYYNPMGGTFFTPDTGVISKPGTTVLLPYVW
jgi:hypothetical protein